MNIKISAKPTKFKFVVESKELDTAISKVVAVVTGQGNTSVKGFLLVAQTEKLFVVGYSADTYIVIVLRSGVPEGVGSFSFNHQTLQGLIKNRGEMEFSYLGQDIAFKSTKGKYEGSVHSEQFTEEQASVINAELSRGKNDVHNAVLPKNVLASLKEGVNLTAVKDVFTSEALLSYLTLSEKGFLNVSSFDKHHFGLYTSKVESKGLSFKVALPSSHFNMIERMAEAEDVKFYVRAESLKVVGDNFSMILPSTQTDEKNYTLIKGYLKELEASTFGCTIKIEALANIVANLFTLHTAKANAIFDLSHKSGGTSLGIKFSTATGSAGDAIKATDVNSSASMAAQIDPRILKDIIALLRSNTDCVLSIVPSRVIKLECTTKLGHVTLVGALAS